MNYDNHLNGIKWKDMILKFCNEQLRTYSYPLDFCDKIYATFISIINKIIVRGTTKLGILAMCIICQCRICKMDISIKFITESLKLEKQYVCGAYIFIVDRIPEINKILGIDKIFSDYTTKFPIGKYAIKHHIINRKGYLKFVPFLIHCEQFLDRDCLYTLINYLTSMYAIDYKIYLWLNK
jgi:hypothetical protein